MQKFHRLQVVEDDEVQALCPQVIEVGHASAEDQIQRIFVFLNVLFFCPTRNRRRKTQLRMKPEKIDFEIFDHSKVGMLKLKLKLLNTPCDVLNIYLLLNKTFIIKYIHCLLDKIVLENRIVRTKKRKSLNRDQTLSFLCNLICILHCSEKTSQ